MSIQAIMKLVSDPFTEAYVKVHDCAYGSITVGDLAMLVYRLRHREARIAELEAALSDFAAHDFTDATKGWPRHPDDDEPSPLTDAHTVWDMQKEAMALLKGGE